jgi:hypothetical protein
MTHVSDEVLHLRNGLINTSLMVGGIQDPDEPAVSGFA